MYKFIKTKSIEEEILKINGLSLKDLDVSNFKLDLNQEVLLNFKNKIIEYQDLNFFIVGDYDFDGISSTTIICRLFDELKIKHNYYIPSRIKEGYGVNSEIVDRAKEYNFDVLLLLDNGIVAYDEIDYAKSLGLKVMVVDHHEYNKLPKADAILHPTLLNKDYTDACTAGLSYLVSSLFIENEYSLVLAGIGSLADMVSVLGYNRYLIKKANELLNTGRFSNINLLNKKRTYTYQDLSFNVIPKINAVSRLGYNANRLVSFFMADGKTAFNMVKDLELINDERKKLTASMNIKANELVDDKDILVIVDESFNEGLCGIVSARLTNDYNKPTLVLSKSDDILKGSGRSTNTFNLYEYLCNIKDIFETFGGHEKALGLSIKEENLNKLLDYIDKNHVEFKEEEKVVLLLEDIDYDTYLNIESLMPFGTNFKEPLYGIKNKGFERYVVSNKYPKYVINKNCEAILFNSDKDIEDFDYLIGKIQKDNYHPNAVSILIEDLVV